MQNTQCTLIMAAGQRITSFKFQDNCFSGASRYSSPILFISLQTNFFQNKWFYTMGTRIQYFNTCPCISPLIINFIDLPRN
jgi:hypothetical protein